MRLNLNKKAKKQKLTREFFCWEREWFYFYFFLVRTTTSGKLRLLLSIEWNFKLRNVSKNSGAGKLKRENKTEIN